MQATRSVTKPQKQRKKLLQAPDHIRYKQFAAPLSPNLRVSHGTRTLPVRSGDTIRIMRGDHEGFEGKITRIDRKNYRIQVEGLTRDKVDGTTIFVPLHPSKIMIINLGLEDKWRKQILERKKRAPKKAKKVEERPPIEETAKEKKVEKEKVQRLKRKRRKKAIKKPAEEKTEEIHKKTRQPRRTAKKKIAEPKKEEKPKKKTRTRRKTVKNEGGR